MIRTFQYKLYPNDSQAKTLARWMGACCWTFNRALDARIKAYRRRGESVTYNQQQALLTQQRERIDNLRLVPVVFARDALRRVDKGFKAFFRRLKAGASKPGFPRFKPGHRYNSLECAAIGTYLKGDRIQIPNLGLICCRGRLLPLGIQRMLRVVRKASGWFAQIVLDDGRQPPAKLDLERAVGVDVGLNHFATLSTGESIANPRWTRRAEHKIRALQRRVSRRQKKSQKRKRAILALRKEHERIADRRRNFCHEQSTRLVRENDLIAVEKLNVSGMVRSSFGKSILDAAWTTFMNQLVGKAESAGRQVVFVDARRTSQTCPNCGAVKPKKLSERVHSCACGLDCDRDHAAAQVILARALVVTGAIRPSMDPAADQTLVVPDQAGQLKREGRFAAR